MALHNNTYVFRFYDELGSSSALAKSCFDIDVFAQVYQEQKWKNEQFFTTFVCAFKPPRYNTTPIHIQLQQHVADMIESLKKLGEEDVNAIDYVQIRKKGFFVPGLQDERHILKTLEWPILVFNATFQFEQLGDDYFHIRELILKRAQAVVLPQT